METAAAYGAGRAGGAFDPLTFIRQPQTIVRAVSWGFCFLTNQWQATDLEVDDPLKEGADAARAAITFSFFSIFTWAAQAFLGYQRYRLGADSALFSQEYTDPSQDTSAPYTPYISGDEMEVPGSYQQPLSTGAYTSSSEGYQTQDY
ncbi:synaptogyrin-1-like [Cetorhinus maximus]